MIKGGEAFLDYGTGSGILAIAALKVKVFTPFLSFSQTSYHNIIILFQIFMYPLCIAYTLTQNLQFGAVSSVGIDIDPLAIKSASHNAALNNIPLEKLELHLATSENSSSGREIPLQKQQFDVVIANILLNPVMELANHILSFAKPGATIGISGILSEQVNIEFFFYLSSQ